MVGVSKKRREYTAEELERLQNVLYELLEEIIRICDKYGISYFIIGGTAIGAFFEQKIIEWDDDIDIGMTRENYEHFLRVAPSELKSDYFLQWMGTEPETPFYFAKVRKNNTLFVEKDFADLPIHQGIYLDIFPFDRVPDNILLQKFQRLVVNFLKCCFMGKTIWMWRHCGKCKIEHPSNRGFIPCLLTRAVDILPKRIIYRMFSAAQQWFNTWNTTYYNLVTTTYDHVPVKNVESLQQIPLGSLLVSAPTDLENYLHHHYPKLRRYIPEEERINHCPEVLSFDSTKL